MTPERNQLRHCLIRLKSMGALNSDEELILAELQQEAKKEADAVAPIDTSKTDTISVDAIEKRKLWVTRDVSSDLVDIWGTQPEYLVGSKCFRAFDKSSFERGLASIPITDFPFEVKGGDCFCLSYKHHPLIALQESDETVLKSGPVELPKGVGLNIPKVPKLWCFRPEDSFCDGDSWFGFDPRDSASDRVRVGNQFNLKRLEKIQVIYTARGLESVGKKMHVDDGE